MKTKKFPSPGVISIALPVPAWRLIVRALRELPPVFDAYGLPELGPINIAVVINLKLGEKSKG